MDRSRHPQVIRAMENRTQQNKWKGLPRRQVRRPSSDNVAIPEQRPSPVPLGISTRKLMLWLLLAHLFAPGLAQTGASQTTVPSSTMPEAARTFLATLDPAQNAKAVLPFNSEERFHWFYTPV